MASSTVSLIINSTASGGGLKATAAELKNQKQLLAQLTAAEKSRAAAAKAAAAQQKAAQASILAGQTRSVAGQQRASAAAAAAVTAQNNAALAAQKHALAMTQVEQASVKASNTGAEGFRRMVSVLGSVAAAAGLAAVAVAGIATAGLANALKGAADAELEAVISKGNVASALGGDRAKAGAFIQDQNSAILSGAAQSGLIDTKVSKEFATIFADDVAKQFGTGKASSALVAGMSNQLSLLTSTGNDKGQLKNVIGDIINGTVTDAQLQGRDVLGSSGLLKPLRDELEKTGKNLKKLNPAERITVLNKALQRALTSDTIQEMTNTVSGQIGVLKNRLFGEQGLFSVLQDTLPTVEGDQTVFEQLKNSMKLLFNSDGLFAQLGRILSASGINLDVMAAIRNGWEKFNAGLLKLNQFLVGVKNFDDLIAQIQTAIESIPWQQIGAQLGVKIREFVTGIDFAAMGRMASAGIGSKLAGSASSFLSGFLQGLTGTSGTALAPVIQLVAGFVNALTNPITQARAIAAGLGQLTSIVSQFSLLLINPLNAVVLIATTTAQTISTLAPIVAQAWTQISTTISQWCSSTLQSVQAAVTSALSYVTSIWTQVSTAISDWCNQTLSSIQDVVSAILASVQQIWTSIQSFVSEQFTAMASTVQDIIQQIITAVTNAWNSLVEKANAIQSALSGLTDVGSIISGAWNSLVEKANSFASSIANLNPFKGGGSKAEGASFTPASYSSSGGGLSIGSLTINAAPGENAEQLADRVLAALDARLRRRTIAQGA